MSLNDPQHKMPLMSPPKLPRKSWHCRGTLETGLLEMTIPDKPQSSKQRYRLTEQGWAVLKKDEA